MTLVHPRRILTTTDFSSHAAAALPYAEALALRYDAELLLVHVLADSEYVGLPPGSVGDPIHEKALRQHAQSRLDAVDFQRLPETRIRRMVESAPTVTEGITSLADQEDVDLIVISTHGRGRVAQLLLGSVARKVFAFAPCPVLAVRRNTRGMLTETGDVSLRHVVVATDLAPRTRSALRAALEFTTDATDTAIDVVNVVRIDLPPAGGMYSMFALDPELPGRVEARMKHLLADDPVPGNVHYKVLEGYPAKQLAHYAERKKTDLIVLSYRGKGEAGRPLGGVPERLLHDSPCPVLIIPHRNRVAAVPQGTA